MFLGSCSMLVFCRGSRGEQLVRSICPPRLPLRCAELIARCSYGGLKCTAAVHFPACVRTGLQHAHCQKVRGKQQQLYLSTACHEMHPAHSDAHSLMCIWWASLPTLRMNPVKQLHVFSSCAAQWGPWQETVCHQAFFIL